MLFSSNRKHLKIIFLYLENYQNSCQLFEARIIDILEENPKTINKYNTKKFQDFFDSNLISNWEVVLSKMWKYIDKDFAFLCSKMEWKNEKQLPGYIHDYWKLLKKIRKKYKTKVDGIICDVVTL